MRFVGSMLVAVVVVAIGWAAWFQVTQIPTPAGTYEHPHTTAVPASVPTGLVGPQDSVPDRARFDGYVYRDGQWIGPVNDGDDTKRGA